MGLVVVAACWCCFSHLLFSSFLWLWLQNRRLWRNTVRRSRIPTNESKTTIAAPRRMHFYVGKIPWYENIMKRFERVILPPPSNYAERLTPGLAPRPGNKNLTPAPQLCPEAHNQVCKRPGNNESPSKYSLLPVRLLHPSQKFHLSISLVPSIRGGVDFSLAAS